MGIGTGSVTAMQDELADLAAETARETQADEEADHGPDDGFVADESASELGIVADLRRRRARRVRGRTVRRWVVRIVIVAMVPVAWSYGTALTGPGHDSLKARTVEWARDNHLGWAVDSAERWWFARHQARVGGVPDAGAGPAVITVLPNANPAISSIPSGTTAAPVPPVSATVAAGSTVTSTAQPSTTSTVSPSTTTPGPVHLVVPAPLVTPAAEPMPGEGQWIPFGPIVDGVQGAYVTSIRPDAVHTSVLDAIIWIDPTVLRLRQYPGIKIPGAPWDRPANVEPERQAQLVAAFAGGFRLNDSHGGMILGHRTLKDLRVGGATFAIDDNGMPNIGAWGTDIVDSPTLDSARQSLDPIVIDGAPASDLATDDNTKWGFTGPDNRSAVWRSAAGIRADGSLIWIGGDGFTIETLAETLVRAGAVRGMQLEINREWVQLNTYTLGADGQVHGQLLLKGMEHTGDRWLTQDTRDFMAVFTR